MAKVILDDLFVSDETTATASAKKMCATKPPPPASIFPGLSPDAQELLLALQWLGARDG